MMMPVLASSFAASLSLCGGCGVLIGSLFVAASLSPSYKKYELDAETSAIGTLIIAIGVAVSFIGAAPRLVEESHDVTAISYGALIAVGFTLIIVFSRPIRMKCKIAADHDEHEAEERQAHHGQESSGQGALAPPAVDAQDEEEASRGQDAEQDVRSSVPKPLPKANAP